MRRRARLYSSLKRLTAPRLAALVVVATAAIFVWANLQAIDRWPAVSRDDVWVMSASYKLAEEGVFGSDMFRGMHHADLRYFIALPVHHLLQAALFRVDESGLRQARLVALTSATVVILASSWLAGRWFGPLAAVVTALLLGFWQLELLGYGNGIPLSVIGVSGRYDATALAFSVLSVVALDRVLVTRRLAWALLCGLLGGVATLTQFFGVFVVGLALLATFIVACRERNLWRLVVGVVVGFAASVLPYIVWAHRYRSDFWGQSELKEGRTSFFELGFYRTNLLDEPSRYRMLLPESASELLVLALPLAIVWLALRVTRQRRRPEALLLAWLVVSAGGLALTESINATLYAIVVLPPAVIAVAALFAGIARWAQRLSHPADRSLVTLALAGLMLVAVWNGAHAYAGIDERADHVASYERVSRELIEAVPANATVVGSERWWWPMRERDYLSLTNLWQQWADAANGPGQGRSFEDLMRVNGATYLLADGDVWFDLDYYPPALSDQIRDWIIRCSVRVWGLVDETYPELQLFELREAGCQ